jgi:hypothetical protein
MIAVKAVSFNLDSEIVFPLIQKRPGSRLHLPLFMPRGNDTHQPRLRCVSGGGRRVHALVMRQRVDF